METKYPIKEQTARNQEIYCKKMGLASINDRKPTLEPKTYRELMVEYNLSIPRLQFIINVQKKKYGKK